MPVKVIMPQLGESVIEGTVTKWLKSPGEVVEEYVPLLEVNTDKVDTEIPSPVNGTLLEIIVLEGTTVSAGTVLALIAEAGEIAKEAREEPVQPATAKEVSDKTLPDQAQTLNGGGKTNGPRAGRDQNLGFISPVVAKIAQEHHLDLYQVRGTGQGGRITKKDVLTHLEQAQVEGPGTGGSLVHETVSPLIPTSAERSTQGHAPSEKLDHPSGDEILPITPVRRAIAEHMLVSKRTSPHVTTVMEADLNRVVAHREANKETFARDGVNLTFTAYFMAAAVAALRAYPLANSSWSDSGILLHRQIHIGIATSLGEAGLIVPVLKNADALSLLGLAQAVNDLANRARLRKLLPEEVKGGTFTITNHGTSGSLFAIPIINQPQAAILGVGAIQKRVVVIGGSEIGDTIAIRPMVYLSLTFDHRILDGAMGDAILGKVVETLENWK